MNNDPTVVTLDNNAEKTIFIQVASYRDPELNNTLLDMLANASYPARLRVGIAWQHSTDDQWDNLTNYLTDERFRIIDIDFSKSNGVCWARNLVQQLYQGEDYTLQLDSHHRFVPGWDEILINMLVNLQIAGYPKPLITAYLPSYEPTNDPTGRQEGFHKLIYERFLPDGVLLFKAVGFDSSESNLRPIMGRFYSAHFAFTLGLFAIEVQHNPAYYFLGEEISIAVRAYTHGYDIFHPNVTIAWHEYSRVGRVKQWDDAPAWATYNDNSYRQNRILFNMEVGVVDEMYGFGTERTLRDYERYAGVSFRHQTIHSDALAQLEPTNVIKSNQQWEMSLVMPIKYCIAILHDKLIESDYDFWYVAFRDENHKELYRKDADKLEIGELMGASGLWCNIWRELATQLRPTEWLVWPHSEAKGWCDLIQGDVAY